MSVSSVLICNSALGMIGAQSIASLDEKTDRARLCKTLYDQTRRSLLRMHPWNCAIKRTELAASAVAPAFGFAYAFPLPADFLRVIEISERDYKIEGREVLADVEPIRLIYVFDNDNEQTWDGLLTEAMSIYMASKLAKPLTGSATEADAMDAALKGLLKQARAIDGQEEPSMQVDPEFALIRARY